MYETTIKLTSTVLKKGKPDIKSVSATSVSAEGKKIFLLSNSKRDFDHMRFTIEPGCIIEDCDGVYSCTNVIYTSHPKHPILTAESA